MDDCWWRVSLHWGGHRPPPPSGWYGRISPPGWLFKGGWARGLCSHLPEFKFQLLCCYLAVWLWARGFTSLCFISSSFFMRILNQMHMFDWLIDWFWLCWVFVSVRGLSLVAASGGHSSSRCAGLSLSRPLSLQSTGSRRAGSVVVAHGPSCSAACGILPGQGSNPCPLH